MAIMVLILIGVSVVKVVPIYGDLKGRNQDLRCKGVSSQFGPQGLQVLVEGFMDLGMKKEWSIC